MNKTRAFVAYFLAAFFALSVSVFAQEAVSVNISQPASDVVDPAQENPVAPIAKGVWNFVPLASKQSSASAPSAIQPPVPSVADKKSYAIVSAEYKLNGVLVHTASSYPDGWKIDTTTLKDGKYTLVSTFHIADGTTETSTSTFTVENQPTIASKVSAFIANTVSFFKGLFKKK